MYVVKRVRSYMQYVDGDLSIVLGFYRVAIYFSGLMINSANLTIHRYRTSFELARE